MTTQEILATEYSDRFDEIRKGMIAVSHFKYGWIKDTYETHKTADAMKSLEMRIKKYQETGNTEYLADIANFAMIEFMYPQHPKAFYKPTDSSESPGLHGMSSNATLFELYKAWVEEKFKEEKQEESKDGKDK